MDQHGIQTIFVESSCDDQELIEQNVRNVKISSPDVLILPSELAFFFLPFPFDCFCSLCYLYWRLMGSMWGGMPPMRLKITSPG